MFLLLIMAANAFDTFHQLNIELFELLNNVRYAPSKHSKEFKSDPTKDFLRSQYSSDKLIWSVGLSNACRDLVLDIGPNGLMSDITVDGRDAKDRAAKHLQSF